MKRVIFLIASIAFFASAEAQYTNKQNASDFNAIEVNAAAHVELVQSDSNYVSISPNESNGKMPRMEVRGGVLIINSAFGGTMEVHVKNIRSIKISDAASVNCSDTLEADNLTIHSSDAGKADILVHAKTLKVHGDDASNITLKGSADSLDVKASDASYINGSLLRASDVLASSSDGSTVSVWAIKSIDANATDGSAINVRGIPAQKNTSAFDGGSVNMYNSTWVKLKGNKIFNVEERDSSVTGKRVNVITGDGFIGGGFVMGGSNGLNIKYGASREFIIGFGGTHRIFKRDYIGFDVYYKSTDFYLAQNPGKSDSSAGHQSEKVSLQNFGMLISDRLVLGKGFYVDGGIYGDWTFHNKLVTWDNNIPDVSSAKTIDRNLSFVNDGNYGLTCRVMGYGLMFYFNYRLSPVFQNSSAFGYENAQLPKCVFGVALGI